MIRIKIQLPNELYDKIIYFEKEYYTPRLKSSEGLSEIIRTIFPLNAMKKRKIYKTIIVKVF